MTKQRTCAYSKCEVKFTPKRLKKGPQYHTARCRVMAWREKKQTTKPKTKNHV